MATKKVETKSRSANPRASAATAKTTAKATAKTTANTTAKSTTEPAAKSKTVAKSTVAKAAPETKAQPAPSAEAALQAEKPVSQTTTKTKQNAPKKVIVSITFEQIAQRAYELWEQRGYSHGNDVDDWCRAEAELSSK